MERSFATTRWSLVVAAGRSSDADSREALSTLARLYWYPLYVYVRRCGYAPADAADHTQAFFARLLAQKIVRGADPARGKFRSYLIGAIKHHLRHDQERARAQKRGGGRDPIPLDLHDAESRYEMHPVHELTPDKLFERQWAVTVLELAMRDLERYAAATGKHQLFQRLKEFLAGDQPEGYANAARDLGIEEGAARVIVHRFRRRYADLIRQQISQTVQAPEQVDDEIRHLFEALRA
jgi:RNA polymerase sigma-70 factor (ECF subfamily)